MQKESFIFQFMFMIHPILDIFDYICTQNVNVKRRELKLHGDTVL